MSRPRFNPQLPGASLANVASDHMPSEAMDCSPRRLSDRVQSVAAVKSLTWGEKIGAADVLISAALDATGEHVHAAKFMLAAAAHPGAFAAAGGTREFSGALQLLFGVEVAANDLTALERLADERARDPSLAHQRETQAEALRPAPCA